MEHDDRQSIDNARHLKEEDVKLAVLMEFKEKIIERWTEFIQELFEDDREALPQIRKDIEGPEILKDEVRFAIKQMKHNKARGPDNIYAELLQAVACLRGSMVNVHWSVDRFCTEGPGFDSRMSKLRLISRMCNGPTKSSIPLSVG